MYQNTAFQVMQLLLVLFAPFSSRRKLQEVTCAALGFFSRRLSVVVPSRQQINVPLWSDLGLKFHLVPRTAIKCFACIKSKKLLVPR